MATTAVAAARHQCARRGAVRQRRRLGRRCCSSLAFGAGLLLAAGPSATQVGVAGTAAALILGHQAQRPGIALHVGLLVLAGGAGAGVLAVAAWPLRPAPPRAAWRWPALYRALADVARRPPGTDAGPPLGDELPACGRRLFGLGHDHGPSVEAYRVLLDEAERIRRELSCSRWLRAAASTGRRSPTLPRRCGAVLDGVAARARRDRRRARARPGRSATTCSTRCAADARRARSSLLDAGGDGPGRPAAPGGRRWPGCAACAGQLRAAVETAGVGATEGARRRAGRRRPRPTRLRDPLAVMRANLSRRLGGVPARGAAGRAGGRLRPGGAAGGRRARLLDPADGAGRAAAGLRGDVPALGAARGRHGGRAAAWRPRCVHCVPGGQWYAIALSRCSSSACGWPGRATSA